MDATRRVACNKELFNPVLTIGMQVSFILVMSHIFQIVLKPLGQPAPVAQILSGFVLGPSGLSLISKIKEIFFQDVAADYYEALSLFSRIIIMFLIGLETDISYLVRNIRSASIVALGGCIMCTIFAIAITPLIYHQTDSHGSIGWFALLLATILSNCASPIALRFATELRFATTEFGRLAISSSLVCDTYAVFLLIISSRSQPKGSLFRWLSFGFLSFLIIVAVIVVNMYLANWLNRRNRNQKYLRNPEAAGILALLIGAAMAIETLGFNSIIASFLIGSMFPRGGKTARTLLAKLDYSVHNFIFPVYLGYIGFQADITTLNSFYIFGAFVMLILLSLGGKISGTLAACSYLKIPINEGVLLAFLMNMKGHIDVIALAVGAQTEVITSPLFYNLLLLTIVINTLIMGPVVSLIVKRESASLGYGHIVLEWQEPEAELRMLACIHNPRHVGTIVGIISALRGSEKGPLIPHLMHLIELPQKRKTNLLYNQREDDELSDEENYGGNDVAEINEAVDGFTMETGVMVHQINVVSPFINMFSDVCDKAEELRASIILLHFHKHRRIDGKMEIGKEGIRMTNQKVLRHAKCSIGILVDRGLARSSDSSGSESLQHVAALFFGGPDDREVLGLSRRLCMTNHINLTVIRFSSASSKESSAGVNVAHKAEEVLMAMSHEDGEADAAVLADFYNKYVTSGQVGYIEKFVENGAETASALRDMAEIYSLFIVGKGGRGHSPLTTGMSDWEECPELGTVGDLLASSDFDSCGSVLVIQQHRVSRFDE